MVINTIIFDFGGVILKTPDLIWLQRWRDRLGLKKDKENVLAAQAFGMNTVHFINSTQAVWTGGSGYYE